MSFTLLKDCTTICIILVFIFIIYSDYRAIDDDSGTSNRNYVSGENGGVVGKGEFGGGEKGDCLNSTHMYLFSDEQSVNSIEFVARIAIDILFVRHGKLLEELFGDPNAYGQYYTVENVSERNLE